MIIRLIYLFFGFCLIAKVNSVQGADQTESTESLEKENTLVITANRVESPLDTLANNTSLVDSSTLELVSHIHINEILTQIPGTWISRGNGQEHLTAIRSPVLTGPGSCGEFLMMEDGIPLRATGFCNVNQLFDANTEQAERIEVVRGANSALYGSNAIHGLINVITPNALSDETKASMEIGPHDYFRYKHSYANISQDSQYLLNFNITDDGGYKDSSGFAQQKVSFRHNTQVNNWQVDTIFSASNLRQETAGFLQQGLNAYRDPQFRRQNDFPEAYRDAHSVRLHSRISGEFGDKAKWSLTPYLRSNEMEFLMHFLPGQPIEKNGHESLGIQWQSQYFHDGHHLTWGLDVERTDGFLEQFQPQTTDTSSAFLNAVLPQGQQYDYQIDASVAALYLNWQYLFLEDWTIAIASRYDYLKYDYDNRMLAGRTRDDGSECGFGGCRYTRPDDRSDSFDEFSSSMSLSRKLNSQNFVYLKFDRAFRAPQATELYRLQNGQLEPQAESEKADSVELGYRLSSENLFFESNLFYMKKDNVIFQNSDREFISGGKTKHQGLELLARFEIADNWDLSSNLTFAKHQYDSDFELQGSGTTELAGNIIDTAPRQIGRVQLGWTLSEDSRMEFEWLHLSDYYTNPDNTRRYSGHDLVNLRLKHSLSSSWTSYIKLVNVTDKLYAERADFAFGNDRYFVGEPRSLYLTLEGRF